MDNNLRFPKLPEGYKASTLNFYPYMYEALIKYRVYFLELYDFLSASTVDPTIIPPVVYSQEPRGLINIFIDKIPHKWGTVILSKMGKKARTNLTNIQDFLNPFYDIVYSFYEHAEKTLRNERAFKNIILRSDKSTSSTYSMDPNIRLPRPIFTSTNPMYANKHSKPRTFSVFTQDHTETTTNDDYEVYINSIDDPDDTEITHQDSGLDDEVIQLPTEPVRDSPDNSHSLDMQLSDDAIMAQTCDDMVQSLA